MAQPVATDPLVEDRGPPWNWWQPETDELVTQWRTSPIVTDLNDDGLHDLVMLDAEGFLSFFERYRDKKSKLRLRTPRRIFYTDGPRAFDRNHNVMAEDSGPLRLNDGWAGRSGRRKLTLVDWDGDGRQDLLVNSASANFLRNVGSGPGDFTFSDAGPVTAANVASHSSSPTTVDWDRNGVPDLLIGAEDGFFYFIQNTHDPYSRRAP